MAHLLGYPLGNHEIWTVVNLEKSRSQDKVGWNQVLRGGNLRGLFL